MDDASPADRFGHCPFVDENDHRCGHRFSVARLEQAFSVCFGAWQSCPMYARIRDEVVPRRPVPFIEVTAHGRAIALRATGT